MRKQNHHLAVISALVTLSTMNVIIMVATPLQQATATNMGYTNDPYTNQLLNDAYNIMGQLDPRDEAWKDAIYDPPFDQAALEQKCMSQQLSIGNELAADHCASIINECAWYGFTVEECYSMFFVQLTVPVPSDVLASRDAKAANVQANQQYWYEQYMCTDPYGFRGQYCPPY